MAVVGRLTLGCKFAYVKVVASAPIHCLWPSPGHPLSRALAYVLNTYALIIPAKPTSRAALKSPYSILTRFDQWYFILSHIPKRLKTVTFNSKNLNMFKNGTSVHGSLKGSTCNHMKCAVLFEFCVCDLVVQRFVPMSFIEMCSIVRVVCVWSRSS